MEIKENLMKKKILTGFLFLVIFAALIYSAYFLFGDYYYSWKIGRDYKKFEQGYLNFLKSDTYGGKTPIIKDQKLIIEPNEWLVSIKNGYPALQAEYLRLEPAKMPMNKAKTEAIASVFARWPRTANNVRTIFERQNEYIYIPDLRPEAMKI